VKGWTQLSALGFSFVEYIVPSLLLGIAGLTPIVQEKAGRSQITKNVA